MVDWPNKGNAMLTQKEMEKQRQAVHEGGKHNCTKEKGKAMTNIYIYNLQVYKSRGGGVYVT